MPNVRQDIIVDVIAQEKLAKLDAQGCLIQLKHTEYLFVEASERVQGLVPESHLTCWLVIGQPVYAKPLRSAINL